MLAAPAPYTAPPPNTPFLPPQQSTVPMQMPSPRSVPPQPVMPDMPPPPAPNRMEATALVYPPERSRTGLVVGGVTAVAVLVAAAFFLVPRKGEIVVSATDAKGDVAHVEVYIDGKKTDCGTSPCTVSDVVAGTHTVKVVAEGYPAMPEQMLNVTSHQQARAAFAMARSRRRGGEHGRQGER